MDVDKLRRDFPVLQRTFHGRPLVYLDSAATTQKPQVVIDAESAFYENQNANVHRGVYALSEEATEAFEAAREQVARFLNAPDPAEVIFVRGTTEAINLVSTSLGRGMLARGDGVLTTVMEHHSNIVPWHLLRTYLGTSLDFVDIDDEGRLRMGDYDAKLSRSTKVVTLSHSSNVLGTVNPVREVAERAHDVGALVVVDAAQSVPHRRVDVQKLGVDFLAFSGHKLLGPGGIGVLWGRRELLEKMPPYMGGGEMIREVHQDSVAYREPPARFEAGSPNAAGAVALARAIDYLEGVGWEEIRSHEQRLWDAAQESMREELGDGITVFGPAELKDREPILSFSLPGVHPHDVASLLDADGIAIRSGHHCAQPLMERLGVPALSRASPYLYNTPKEMESLFVSLKKVESVFEAKHPPISTRTS
jgi:cysteine desulfurase/selenocysteine lyase